MRKFIAIICAATMFMSSFTVMGAISDGDSDGDVVENPWKELFTTEAGENNTTKAPDTETTKQPAQDGKQNPDNAAVNDAALNSAEAVGSAVQDAIGKYKAVVADGTANIVNIQEPGFATQPGIYVELPDANLGDMTVNGAELSKDVQGAGVILHLSNFEYQYSEVVIKNSDGTNKAVIHVYYEDGKNNVTGEVNTTKQDNPTSKDQGDDTTTTAPGGNDNPTTAGNDNPTTTPKSEQPTNSGYNPGFNPAELTYTDVACTGDDSKDPLGYAAKDGATIEGLNPWYGDGGNTFMLQYADPNGEGPKANVTINGEQPASGAITEKAQGLVKINPNTLPDDSYTVVTVTLDSGKEATFVIKKGNPSDVVIPTTAGSDNPTTTQGGNDNPTTAGGDNTTTKAPGGNDNPTTAGNDNPTTKAPASSIDMNQSFTTDGDKNLGGYVVYVGQSWNNSTAVGGVDPQDPDHIKVQQKSSNWGEAWGLQVSKILSGLNPGEVYTIEWPIAAASTDGKVKLTGDAEVALTGGSQTLTGSFTAGDDGSGKFTVGMGWVGLENPIEFYQPTIKDANGNVVYPGGNNPTTTAQGGNDNPTTAPGGNDNPTTAPGGNDNPTTASVETTTAAGGNVTTAAPATTAKVANANVGKTKVKKAAKKKAAKKMKVTLKKIKGANGYQIRVYKTKKNAKKNKKAIVKKTLKKNKATLKSKKLANKSKLFVRARAYKVVGGAKKFGKWSAVKKAKVK